MKYKLINSKTKEEHICDKVTIDGFDYYVSDMKVIHHGEYFITDDKRIEKSAPDWRARDWHKKIIATNNPNIDIPKVVDEVEILSKDTYTKHSVKDDSLSLGEQIQRIGGFLIGYKEGYNKSQETHPFSEEDMVLFGDWLNKNASRNNVGTWGYFGNLFYTKTTKELLQLWKEQQPKTLYYE